MNYAQAKAKLERYNQTQLLRYFDELAADEKAELLNDIDRTDFSVLDAPRAQKGETGKLSPADALSLKEIAARREEFKEIGTAAIKEGKVAAVLLAGGQGTRLGLDAPKGTFNIGVNRQLSIFGCQMSNLSDVAKEIGAYPHLFIMTSNINDGATRAFFRENGNFGYPGDRIHFYIQKTAPCISTDGKVLLAEKHRIALSPNGNGGWYNSLIASGCAAYLDGVEWLNVYGVDNVLQRICDPVFVGATIVSGAACASKVVKKSDPEERVGVLCKEDGLPSIVEYYEMSAENNNLRGADGELVYCYGVILNYLFSVKGLNVACERELPYHLALKKVPCVVDGVKVSPEKPNGYKMETLAVDIVKLMGSCLAFEVEREREFAPVKNKVGVDSVETARALLVINGVKI